MLSLWPIVVVLNMQGDFSLLIYLLCCCKALCKALQSLPLRDDSPGPVKS